MIKTILAMWFVSERRWVAISRTVFYFEFPRNTLCVVAQGMG